jgi:hypothetical protein
VNKPVASLSGVTRPVRPALVVSAALIVLLLAGLMFVTGCNAQTGVDTNVNEDGSGTVGIRLAADKDLQDALSGVAGSFGGQAGAILGILGDLGGLGGGMPTSVDELFNLVVGQIPGDWTVERGTDSSGARWISVTRSFANPEELQQILSGQFLSSVIATDNFSLTQDNGFFTNKTRYSATADAGSVTSRAQSAAGLAQSVLGQVLTVENRVTLPGTLKDNNADEIRGNTLVWNVGTSGSKEMHATSTIYNWGAIAGTVILGVAIIVGLVIVLILVLRRRRRKPAPEQPGAAQPAPALQPETAAVIVTEPPSAETATEPDVSIEPAPATVEVSEDPPAVAPAEEAAAPANTAAPAAGEAAEAAPSAEQASVAAATVVQAETATETPRPVVPIPLRPTKAQQTVPDTPAVAEAVAPQAPAEAPGPAGAESGASS